MDGADGTGGLGGGLGSGADGTGSRVGGDGGAGGGRGADCAGGLGGGAGGLGGGGGPDGGQGAAPAAWAVWADETGVVALPRGARVRGRRLSDPASPADFALVLAPGPGPAWPHRRVEWPDFWVPADRGDALDAFREAHRRAYAGQRVEAACRGGVGRTGTTLAALAILDGLSPDEALAWVRRGYHPRAVENFVQRRWLRQVR